MNTFNLFQFFSLSAMEVMDFTIDCIVSCPILVPFYCVLVLVFVCTISLSAKTIVFVVKCCKITFSYYMFLPQTPVILSSLVGLTGHCVPST